MFDINEIDSKNTFLICTPPYKNNSAGIILLHELCDAINQLGYTCFIVLIDTTRSEWTFHVSEDSNFYCEGLKRSNYPINFNDGLMRKLLDKCITIYPEIITSNPLKARYVVRYFLNKDGFITGKRTEYKESDFCLAFSKVFFDNPHATLTKPIRNLLFNSYNSIPSSNRSLNLTYFGKGAKFASCFRIDDSVMLPSEWPKTKEELSILLRNTRYLYCWDSQTSLATDAIYCGAILVLLQFAQVDEESLNQSEFGPVPYLKAELIGNKATILQNLEYDLIRENYLKNLNKFEIDWLTSVEDVLDKIRNHFKLL
jgi:hypothetical protein